MTSLPLVSVVTPSFNQVHYLEKTICSVLGQDYPALEYIIMDGGSTDGSVDLIRSYAPRLKGWFSEPDAGQADAINKGFQRAEGEIIAWLNSDDWYLPGAVAAAVKMLQEHPECGLVYGDVVAVDELDRPINLMRCADWNLTDLMSFNIIGQPTVFMRRSALQQAGGSLDTSLHFLLDHQLWIRIAANSPIFHLPRYLAAARYHEGAKNIALAAQFGEDAYRLVEWMRSDPRYAGLFEENRPRIMAAAHWFNARYLSVGGLYARSLNAYFKSLFTDPVPVFKDWKRFVMTLLAFVGIRGLYPAYLERRKKRLGAEIDWDILTREPLKTSPAKPEGGEQK